MPRLIIKALDPNAKGSFGDWRRAIRLQQRIEKQDLSALDELIELVVKYASTDDGSAVEPLLAELSLSEFVQCVQNITTIVQETIPNAS